MKCLRCGYCCIHYEVVIIKDASQSVGPDNFQLKPGGERCPHLMGDKPGEFSCAIHDHPDYPQTPCFEFGQIEASVDDPCRMGEYILADKKRAYLLVTA